MAFRYMANNSAYQVFMFSTNHQLRPVLQRFRQMHGLDSLTSRQIRNRARQLEHPVIPPR
jgi:hypothetical protein